MQWHHYFIAIGVAVDLYEKFKGRKKTLALVRPKDMIERLEENISEQLRLMTAVEYNGKRSPQ